MNPWAALAPSVGLYLAIQIGDLNFPNYPTSGTWFFNPMAWQMMFVASQFQFFPLPRSPNV
ncbi:OpgC domain-containing protein [Magnetospirillum molischianum]|uniref:OpgC domain-containing protein n=1 Tax=Magnetospirillum molischianum TaxID=1083 RepID=UPI0009D93172